MRNEKRKLPKEKCMVYPYESANKCVCQNFREMSPKSVHSLSSLYLCEYTMRILDMYTQSYTDTDCMCTIERKWIGRECVCDNVIQGE